MRLRRYTYPAALSMLRIAGSIGRFPMPGLDPGDVPAEGFAAMNAELAEPSPDVEEYTKASYGAVSRAGGLAWVVAGAEWPPLPGRGLRGVPAATGRERRPYRLGSRWVLAAGAQVQVDPAALPLDLIDLALAVGLAVMLAVAPGLGAAGWRRQGA
jgi:hypothetical protein